MNTSRQAAPAPAATLATGAGVCALDRAARAGLRATSEYGVRRYGQTRRREVPRA